MSISIPVNVRYPNPVTSFPSALRSEEKALEGDRFIPIEILWASFGGAGKCVSVDLSQNSTNPLSRILSMYVDNSMCGCDVTFIFPSSLSTIVIPAYESVMVPVPSLTTQFYVAAAAGFVKDVDVTRADIYNFVPPPLSIPKSAFQSVAATASIAYGNGLTQLVPSTVTGTIENIYLQASFDADAAFNAGFLIEDAASNPIAVGAIAGPMASYGNLLVVDMENVNIRFGGGVLLLQAGTYPTRGSLQSTILYRSP